MTTTNAASEWKITPDHSGGSAPVSHRTSLVTTVWEGSIGIDG